MLAAQLDMHARWMTTCRQQATPRHDNFPQGPVTTFACMFSLQRLCRNIAITYLGSDSLDSLAESQVRVLASEAIDCRSKSMSQTGLLKSSVALIIDLHLRCLQTLMLHKVRHAVKEKLSLCSHTPLLTLIAAVLHIVGELLVGRRLRALLRTSVCLPTPVHTAERRLVTKILTGSSGQYARHGPGPHLTAISALVLIPNSLTLRSTNIWKSALQRVLQQRIQSSEWQASPLNVVNASAKLQANKHTTTPA